MIYLLFAIAIYFALVGLYQLLMSVASYFHRDPARLTLQTNRFQILIPAYKEDQVILETARRAARQTYPQSHFEVVVIGDQLKSTTLQALKEEKINVLEADYQNSTKVKALQLAVRNSEDGRFDYAVILDADNLVVPHFLNQLNNVVTGHNAVQGLRESKNGENRLSQLDGFSEFANAQLSCAGPAALGLSSRLAGSGMAIPYWIFKNHIEEMQSVSGFDKELELRLTKSGVKIDYAPKVVVLDEKTSDEENFQRQRARWITAQYQWLMKFAPYAGRELISGNLDFIHRLAHLLLPPRFLAFVFLPLLIAISALVSAKGALILLCLGLSSLIAAYMLIVMRLPAKAKTLYQLIASVLTLGRVYIKALFLIPKARKVFIHTVHRNKFA